MSDINYNPEAYGLRTVGEVEFSSGSYEFNTTVVWQDVDSGKLYYAHDSGCSCPTPFEGYDRTNITPVNGWQELLDALNEEVRNQYWWSADPEWTDRDRQASVDGQIGQLIVKVRELLK